MSAEGLVQCQGVTAKGAQCGRMVKLPETYCWQHQNQKGQGAKTPAKTPPKLTMKPVPKPTPRALSPVKAPTVKAPIVRPPTTRAPSPARPPTVKAPTVRAPSPVRPPTVKAPATRALSPVRPPTVRPPTIKAPTVRAPSPVRPPTVKAPATRALSPVRPPTVRPPTVRPPSPKAAPRGNGLTLAPLPRLTPKAPAKAAPRVTQRPASPVRTQIGAALPITDRRKEQPTDVQIGDEIIPIDQLKFHDVYIPITQPLEKDEMFAEKIGGHEPYFKLYDGWPTYKDIKPEIDDDEDYPLTFVMQFTDPRPGAHEFVQIFIPNIAKEDEDAMDLGVYIKRFRKSMLDTVREIREPAGVPNNFGLFDKPRRITGWDLKKELDFESIFDMINTVDPELEKDHDAYNEVVDAVTNTIMPPVGAYTGIKIGGYGETTQNIVYSEFINNLINGQYGDGGVLHVTETGEFVGDQ